MEFLEILLVEKQLVLAVSHFTRGMRLALAFGDGEIEVLCPGGSDVEKIRPLTRLYGNGVYVLLPTVIPSPVRLVAIAFHNSVLESKR